MQENLIKSLAEVMEFVGLCPLEDTTGVYNYGKKLEDEVSFRKLTISGRKKTDNSDIEVEHFGISEK